MRFVFIALLCCVVLCMVDVKAADACGMFTTPRVNGLTAEEVSKTTPYLSVERTLVMWDRETKEEDFIREARFERASQGFGFVVPTPTKPEVFPVKDPPFDRLQERIPYVPYKKPPPKRSWDGHGALGGSSGAEAKEDGEPVQVLAKQTIGSFTAFTLQASEAGAFDKWLGENGFVAPEAARPWLDHYIKLKFFFVAFKYDPPEAAGATKKQNLTSETVRIRFKAPKPYYPYMDATNPRGMDQLLPRTLLGWWIVRDQMIDIARHAKEKSWRRPWAKSWRTEATPERLGEVLGAELAGVAPKADKVLVQPFRDLKTSRAGYGDVVLVNLWNDETFTQADKDAHRVLLGVLDPVLAGDVGDDLQTMKYTYRQLREAWEAEDKRKEEAEKKEKERAARAAKGCATAPAESNGGAWLFALAALALAAAARKRETRVLLLALSLIGCDRTSATADAGAAGAADTPVSPAEAADSAAWMRPLTTEEREERAFDILRGHDPTRVPEDKDERQRPVPGLDLEFEPKAAGEEVDAGGSITAMARLRAYLTRCYANALKAEPMLWTLELDFVLDVDAEGRVRNAAPGAGTKVLTTTKVDAGADADLAGCAAKNLAHAELRAPEPAQATKAKLHVKFHAEPPSQDP